MKILEEVGRKEAADIFNQIVNDYDEKDENDIRYKNVVEHLWQLCTLMLLLEDETMEDMIEVMQDIKYFADNLDFE